MNSEHHDQYAQFLKASGFHVYEIEGRWWYRYNGFLRPAYLPHEMPPISTNDARCARQKVGCLFARWDTDFNLVHDSPWWYVMRSGPYSLEQVSGNTRSKIRRGMKRLEARPMTIREVRQQGMQVCRKAARRYGRQGFVPRPNEFSQKITAAEAYPGSSEFFGVFRCDQLVGFSENHIQNNGVFWESIWYDPDALKDYSSYVLTHAMLDYYLNDKAISYVSDGSRALYHATNVQGFFVEKFGFERRYACLHIDYSTLMRIFIGSLYPLRNIIELINRRARSDWVARVHGLLTQEAIARACTMNPA